LPEFNGQTLDADGNVRPLIPRRIHVNARLR
jgi:hypothetical protein